MGSSSAFLFAVDTSLSLGMRVYDSMPGLQHGSAVSSLRRHGAPPTYASNRIQKMYSCRFCPRRFKCLKALGGHQKAHRDIRQALYWRSSSSYAASLHRASLDAQPFVAWRMRYYQSLARSVPPSFPWQTGTGGLVPSQPSSSVPAVKGYRRTRDEGHLGGLRGVNHPDIATDGIDLTLKL